MGDSQETIKISDIVLDAGVLIPNLPDEETKEEISDYENQRKEAELRGLVQDIEERKVYASKIFTLIVWWVIAIFVIIILQGFGVAFSFFRLSNGVLTTLIGGTTINILGIFIIVAKYLFPNNKR